MLTMYEGVPVGPELEIVALSEHSWRVSDSRRSPADADGMLAYVERDAHGVEVMLLRPGRVETVRTDCLAAALALVGSRMEDA
ncbi:hypothetical protein [Leifsonia sp. NPDC080035]|uniref:Uncharacterized protein n=1 Tax=Leifsonia sp. NPDC080035 TaxID=3143936 RepID=A0AAU7G8J0_9MICO